MAQREMSRALSSECSISEELEMLAEIYVDELVVLNENDGDRCGKRVAWLELELRPSTAQVLASQHVCLTLSISVPREYPKETPTFEIRKPRGLSDAHIDSMLAELHGRAAERKGTPMLFELIELVKDHLTDNNRPFGSCSLCLYNFKNDDSFHRTDCYHYFHTKCIADYISFLEKTESEALCPVCRLNVVVDALLLTVQSDENEEADDVPYVPDASVRVWQSEMAVLYNKQVERGGIIGKEKEQRRTVLEISTVPCVPLKAEPVSPVAMKETRCESESVGYVIENRDEGNEPVLQTDKDKAITEKGELKAKDHSRTEQRNTKQWTGRSCQKPRQRKQYVRRDRNQYKTQEEEDAVPSRTHKCESRGCPPPGFTQIQPTEMVVRETVTSIQPAPGCRRRDCEVLPQAKSTDSSVFSDKRSSGRVKEHLYKSQYQGNASGLSRYGRPYHGQRETDTYRSKGKSQAGKNKLRTEPVKCRDSKNSIDRGTSPVK